MSSVKPSPILLAALLCDNVLVEKDGTLSAIRIIDKVTLNIPTGIPAELSKAIDSAAISTNLLVCLKSGEFSGDVTVDMRVQSPSGKIGETKTIGQVPLKGAESGYNLVTVLTLTVKRAGVHWIELMLNGEIRARIPLLIALAEGSAPLPDPDSGGE